MGCMFFSLKEALGEARMPETGQAMMAVGGEGGLTKCDDLMYDVSKRKATE